MSDPTIRETFLTLALCTAERTMDLCPEWTEADLVHYMLGCGHSSELTHMAARVVFRIRRMRRIDRLRRSNATLLAQARTEGIPHVRESMRQMILMNRRAIVHALEAYHAS